MASPPTTKKSCNCVINSGPTPRLLSHDWAIVAESKAKGTRKAQVCKISETSQGPCVLTYDNCLSYGLTFGCCASVSFSASIITYSYKSETITC